MPETEEETDERDEPESPEHPQHPQNWNRGLALQHASSTQYAEHVKPEARNGNTVYISAGYGHPAMSQPPQTEPSMAIVAYERQQEQVAAPPAGIRGYASPEHGPGIRYEIANAPAGTALCVIPGASPASAG